MTKKRLVIIVTVILAGIAVVLISASRVRRIVKSQPITFRYVKTGEFNNRGYISFGTIFWATNHTNNTLAISLSAIEVKDGSNFLGPPVEVMSQEISGD